MQNSQSESPPDEPLKEDINNLDDQVEYSHGDDEREQVEVLQGQESHDATSENIETASGKV